MIPTLLLLGLVAGFIPRGWIFIFVATIGWPLLLLATSVDSGFIFIVGSGALAAVNTILGTMMGMAIRTIVGRTRRKGSA